MSMSISSSFEALCAESFFGQKVSQFKGQAPPKDAAKQVPAAVKMNDLEKGKVGNSSPKKLGDLQRNRAPRFAPEFDGLHCFETIIPY